MANQLRISYDKNKLIGEGRYGRVFKGELVGENGSKVQVAVKRIQREYISSKLSKNSEDRELDHQLKLGQHPNVVQLLHWEDQGEDFRCYALEFCDFSLDKVYEDPGNYRELVPNQLDFMLQLSLGLEYIHNKNLIHRDIKPENVLVISKHSDSGNPLVKWGDFGLSKATRRGECTMSGQRGTNWYWAPEIWKMSRNNNYRSAKKDDTNKEMTTIMSDIFSSGCVFFEFCTDGVHPFGEGSDIITNLSMEQSNPYNLKELKLKEDHFAYKIIKKMLENDPKTRLNLREIIPSLIALRSMVSIHETNETLNNNSENLQTRQIEKGYQTSPFISDVNQEEKVNSFVDIDEAKQQLEKMKIELHYLCSRAIPTSEEIGKITEISAKDSVGLVNMVDDDGFSPLIMICRNNRSGSLLQCIKALLKPAKKKQEFQVDVNYQDRSGYTALHYICSLYHGKDFLEIFEILNQFEIDVNKTVDEWGNSALQLLFREYKSSSALPVQIVRDFIKRGIDLKRNSTNGWTTLHHLCRYYTHDNLIEIAKLLIDNGVDVTAKECNGWTALHQLCRFYNHANLIDILQLLIDNGVEVNTNVYDGFTPLHHLCRHYSHDNLIDVIKLLIKNGVHVTTIDSDGWNVLHLLCRYYTHDNLPEVIKLILIDDCVDVIKQIYDGWTPLHNLCRHYTHDNLIDVAKLLIDNGADVTTKTLDGWTILNNLCRNYTHPNLFDLVKLMIEKGADVKEKGDDGWTSLLVLCRYYKYDNLFDIAKLMIENGADVSAKAYDEWTSLHYLCQFYNHDNLIDLVKLLIVNGIDVTSTMENGWNALHYLCRYYTCDNLIELVQLLIDNGTDVRVKTKKGETASDLLNSSFYKHENKSKVLELLKNGYFRRNALSRKF